MKNLPSCLKDQFWQHFWDTSRTSHENCFALTSRTSSDTIFNNTSRNHTKNTFYSPQGLFLTRKVSQWTVLTPFLQVISSILPTKNLPFLPQEPLCTIFETSRKESFLHNLPDPKNLINLVVKRSVLTPKIDQVWVSPGRNKKWSI